MHSKRAQSIDPSGIRKAFAMAAKLKNPCDLSIGKPHFDLPENVKAAAVNAIQEGKNGYTQSQGIDELRKGILKRYEERGIPQEDALITSGVSGGLVLALLALTDPGDEVVIPDPYFLMYKQLPIIFGVKPVIADTYPDFRWRRETLEAAISPKTKVIFVGSPSNPTGLSISQEEAELIVEVARKHDLWVIYDEIYEAFCFDSPHIEMSALYSKTITLGGFSKSHAMTGLRVGTAVGPQATIAEMTKLQQISFVCSPSVGQWAAAEAMTVPVSEHVQTYKENRDYLAEALKDDFEIVIPNGAFYFFIKAPEGFTGEEFVFHAIDHELIMVPGSTFSEKNTHFRISFAASKPVLERAVGILKKLAQNAKERRDTKAEATTG